MLQVHPVFFGSGPGVGVPVQDRRCGTAGANLNDFTVCRSFDYLLLEAFRQQVGCPFNRLKFNDIFMVNQPEGKRNDIGCAQPAIDIDMLQHPAKLFSRTPDIFHMDDICHAYLRCCCVTHDGPFFVTSLANHGGWVNPKKTLSFY